jgi:hypothetical protein
MKAAEAERSKSFDLNREKEPEERAGVAAASETRNII